MKCLLLFVSSIDSVMFVISSVFTCQHSVACESVNVFHVPTAGSGIVQIAHTCPIHPLVSC